MPLRSRYDGRARIARSPEPGTWPRQPRPSRRVALLHTRLARLSHRGGSGGGHAQTDTFRPRPAAEAEHFAGAGPGRTGSVCGRLSDTAPLRPVPAGISFRSAFGVDPPECARRSGQSTGSSPAAAPSSRPKRTTGPAALIKVSTRRWGSRRAMRGVPGERPDPEIHRNYWSGRERWWGRHRERGSAPVHCPDIRRAEHLADVRRAQAPFFCNPSQHTQRFKFLTGHQRQRPRPELPARTPTCPARISEEFRE